MNKSLITEPLGLFGWSHLEPVILAALASESPMLLIGKHGAAKSFLLERLAEALHLEFRCYNASLINYDDLVGIPVPINNNTSLSYISNPNSIWDAEVVFIDELNRTKPELQNKLFPIIYDKRVQGIKLDKLKYRWSAMNPPVDEENEDEENDINYLGAMSLDPALADRFPFIIEVPQWEELNESDRRNMLKDNHLGRHEFPVDIFALIEKTKKKYNDLLTSFSEETTNYTITLMELLKISLGYISARRATMLEDTLLYVFAAYSVLSEYSQSEIHFHDAAFLHIQNTIPNITNKRIDKSLLMNICQQALQLANLTDSVEKSILLNPNPIKRLIDLMKNKKEVSIDIINDVITDSLKEITYDKKRRAMALFTYLSFRNNREIHAAVIETLANEIRPLLVTKSHISMEVLSKKKIADTVVAVLNGVSYNEKYKDYLNNYLCSYLPNDYSDENEVRACAGFFVSVWKEIGL